MPAADLPAKLKHLKIQTFPHLSSLDLQFLHKPTYLRAVSQPPTQKQRTGRPQACQSFFFSPGVNLPFSAQQLEVSSPCSAASPPSRLPACELPLCCLNTLGPDAAYLDDSHCHSISTTFACHQSSPGGDASTNLLLRERARQPIVALVGLERQPKRPIRIISHHHRCFVTNGMCTACRWTQTGDRELSSGSEMCMYMRFQRDELLA